MAERRESNDRRMKMARGWRCKNCIESTGFGWLIRHDGGRHKADNVDTVLETDFKGQSHRILDYILAS
jgi:hypothetical protein